jgi:hypothetical protein
MTKFILKKQKYITIKEGNLFIILRRFVALENLHFEVDNNIP